LTFRVFECETLNSSLDLPLPKSQGTSKMTQQNTDYEVFVQARWAQHKRQYPDELKNKETDFNKQCSLWRYNLSEQEWLDDGHSMTSNLIARIRTLCQQQSNSKVFLCSSVNHYASAGMQDEGWGCGFRNLFTAKPVCLCRCSKTYLGRLTVDPLYRQTSNSDRRSLGRRVRCRR
jgi:hypothetical protein